MIDMTDMIATVILDGDKVVAFRTDKYSPRLIAWLKEYPFRPNQKLVILDTWCNKARVFSFEHDLVNLVNQVRDWLEELAGEQIKSK